MEGENQLHSGTGLGGTTDCNLTERQLALLGVTAFLGGTGLVC